MLPMFCNPSCSVTGTPASIAPSAGNGGTSFAPAATTRTVGLSTTVTILLVLLPGFGSASVALTIALFVRLTGSEPEGMLVVPTVIVRLVLAPTPRFPATDQVNKFPLTATPADGDEPTNVLFGGNVSVKLTLVATLGPKFCTVS